MNTLSNRQKSSFTKTQRLTFMAMFTAIIVILSLTPIGFIPLPFVRATTVHIPVIIGALILGPKHGAVLGFVFGLMSLYNNTFNAIPTSFVFSPFYELPGQDGGSWLALIVVFVPRILTGVVPWFVFIGLKKILHKNLTPINWVAAGIAGSMTNTLLVMHFIYIFFGDAWNSARAEPADVVYTAIIGIVGANGVPEALVAGVLVVAIMGALTVVVSRVKR